MLATAREVSDILQHMNIPVLANQQKLYCLENLPRVMAYMDRRWERIKGIYPVSMPW